MVQCLAPHCNSEWSLVYSTARIGAQSCTCCSPLRYCNRCSPSHDTALDTVLNCTCCTQHCAALTTALPLTTALHSRRAQKDQQSTVCRSCPVCRKVSYFVVPSCRFVTGELKKEALKAHLARLAAIPCTDPFDCQFGPQCVNLHSFGTT